MDDGFPVDWLLDLLQLWEMNQLKVTPTAIADMLKAVKSEKIKLTLRHGAEKPAPAPAP